jgi:NADPH-ferrihemoprotein reductase
VKGAAAFPDDSQPVVAVCTGSGVAPVRAMVRQRDARFVTEGLGSDAGGTTAPTLVFFGCRHASRDFLYADEWAELERRGTLRGNEPNARSSPLPELPGAQMFVPVFSRDGHRKRYVSRAVRERSRSVWEILRRERSAIVVCGSSGAMPEDVHESLVDVCAREGGMDDAQARAFLRRMDARGDYVVEAW